jgi:hypothetical protein
MEPAGNRPGNVIMMNAVQPQEIALQWSRPLSAGRHTAPSDHPNLRLTAMEKAGDRAGNDGASVGSLARRGAAMEPAGDRPGDVQQETDFATKAPPK